MIGQQNGGRPARCLVESAAVGQHQGDVVGVTLINDGHGAEIALALGALVIEQVVAEGAATQKLAAAGDFEPLGGCFAGLELRHRLRLWHKQTQYDVGVRSSKFLLRLAPLSLLLLASGCRAAEPVRLQWPVTPPPALQAQDPRLWVALAARLGSGDAAAPLVLRSAAGSLSLRDASGQHWRAERVSVRWQRQPLAQPFVLERLVAGPYASFESAERVAQRWRRLGVAVALAQPADWEVWAPLSAAVPPGLVVRRLQQRVTTAVLPQLVLPGQAPQPLQGPLQIEAPGGLRWQDGVYAGPFRLQSDAHGSWTLVEQVPLERYLEGVVPHEIGAASPAAALDTQAVLARTWALRNQHRYQADGYHLCASTQCQVYSDPRQASGPVQQAIRRTRHQLLTWAGEPIHAVYHASNGGVAAALDEAWDAAPLPYLSVGLDRLSPGLADALAPPPLPGTLASLLQQQAFVGFDHPLFRWTRVLDRDQIAVALAQRGIRIGQVQQLQVLQRGPSGRVLALELKGSSGAMVLRLDAIRRTLRRLPSTLFELRLQAPGVWRFEGGGFGHGVGLSQAGAIALASRGWSAARILQRYYPGTSLQGLQQLTPSALGPQP